ncbi:MAG: HEAT repeat domain-containing protein [Longimicrobiales bacterium]|nr:HEAT repeat domain-containing protein [Longimicrobiales bacterium]
MSRSVVILQRALRLLPGLMLTGAVAAQGQLPSAAGDARDGSVRFTFPVKPGVEICDDGVHAKERRASWRRGSLRDRGDCRTGTALVELQLRSGVVQEARLIRPSESETGSARDLGHLPAEEAAAAFLDLARRGATPDAAKDILFFSTLADAEDVWRGLVTIARDRALDQDVRKGALFWLGQEVADAVTGELQAVAVASDEEQDVRESAIFAISQRPPSQAIPALIEVARTAEDAETLRASLFWLAQFQDERVVDFFEDMLSGPVR